MKILQLSNRVPWPLNEGGTIGIYNFTKAFSEQGHEVYLYCLDGLKHATPIAEAQRELSKYASCLIHPIDTDVKWDEALKNLFSKDSYNIQRFNNESFRDELKQLLQKEQFDLIQLEGSYVGPYVDLVRSYHRGIISLRMHNAEFEIWARLAQNERNPIKAQYLKLLANRLKNYERELLQKVDCVVAVSPDDLKKFKALEPNLNGMVIPAGIDTDKWMFSPSSSVEKLYHIGSLEWHANREAINHFLSEIWPSLKESDQSLSFHLAGKGIQASSFDNDIVTVYPEVADAYVFIESLDVCIVPLLSGSGIRLKILEAMSAGKLVISTKVGAQGIAYQDGIHLCIAETAKDWINCIASLKANPERVKKITAAARQLIEEKYSIDAVSKELMEFYCALAKEIQA